MPRTPKFRAKNTSRGRLLQLPENISDTGKLQRRYFQTRDAALAEATTFRNEYKDHGEEAMALPPRIADQALAGCKLPEGTGAGLIDAARAFRELWDSQNSSQPFGMAVATSLAAREDLRKNTRDSRLDFRRREQFRCLAKDQPQAVILDRAIRHFRPLERAGQQLTPVVARLAQLETPANQRRCDFPGRAAEKQTAIWVQSRPVGTHRERRVTALLETVVEGIAADRRHPQPGMHCSWCQLRNECMAWLPSHMLPVLRAA